jgi:ABC-2 type transport system ATP-binding protein
VRSDDAIAVEGLRKRYHTHRSGWRGLLGPAPQRLVLDGVTLSVRWGEIFGLLGPNGAGKTTLMKILGGLVLPDEGQAVVNGYEVVRHNRDVRRSIGMVYGDERSFYWRLSLYENLRFYATLYGLRGRTAAVRIDELLAALDLEAMAQVRMHALSTGMKQRAAVARGLLNDPPIIFMDEPTRSLDPVAAGALHALIRRRVASDGRTILLATNQMSEAEAVCDRLALIDHGRTLLSGTVADFKDSLHHELVYELMLGGARDGWQRGLRAIPGVLEAGIDTHPGELHSVRLVLDRNASSLPLVIRYLVEWGLDIRHCDRQEPTLDDVFREAIAGRHQPVLQAGVR